MDLFGHNEGKGFFCPYDGEKLTESRWEWCGRYALTCPNNHLWDVSNHSYIKDRLEFAPVHRARCGCGQVVPERNLRSVDGVKGKRVCPDCFEIVKRAWRPDVERSIARLTITPVKRAQELIFTYEERVEIHPYPNPYGCGGCWGMGGKQTEGEVDELIKDFKSWNEQWEKLGVKLEVIRKPEMTAAEHINERERDYVEEHPEEADKPEHTQMQLIA